MESLIGNKSDFAIQVMTENNLAPPSAVWGRMCLWVNNTMLGDYTEAHCGIYQCVHHLIEVVNILDQLSSAIIINKCDIEAYNYLKSAWLEPDTDEFGEPSEVESFHKYNISYGLAEMFDKEPMFFLVNTSDGFLKILMQSKNNQDITSHTTSVKTFSNVISELNTWYKQQSEALQSDNA